MKRSTNSSTALRTPIAQQSLANGRSVEMPDVGISIIVIAVSLTGFRYSYQQEYVFLVNRQLSHSHSQACSLIFQTDLGIRIAAITNVQ